MGKHSKCDFFINIAPFLNESQVWEKDCVSLKIAQIPLLGSKRFGVFRTVETKSYLSQM